MPDPSEQETLYARVTTVSGSLNLRAAAASNAKVLRTIPQYAVIPILSQGDVWCRTSYEGVTGLITFNEIGDANRTTAYVKHCNTDEGIWEFVAEQGVE